jgi:hypothetical protein
MLRFGGRTPRFGRSSPASWSRSCERFAEAGGGREVNRAGIMAMRAGEVMQTSDLGAAGHALIGCSVTLGLAALSTEHGHEHRVFASAGRRPSPGR